MELDSSVPIADQCRVFRMIRPDWIKDGENGLKRPKSQAFSNSSDDGAMSVFLEDGLAHAGFTLDDVLYHERWRGTPYGVWSFSAKFLRADLGQLIIRDPVPDIPGHGAVSHPGSNRRPDAVRAKMARCGEWARIPQ